MTFEERLTEFYIKRHKQLCQRMARFTKASPEVCEDLVHNVYESCLRWKHSYAGNNFVTYIIGVAKNIIRKYFKYGFNYWSESDQWAEMVELEDSPVPPEQLVLLQEKYMKRKAAEFVASLPSRQQEIGWLVLRGMESEDIQQITGLTQTNVTSVMSVVIKKGKRWMRESNLCWGYSFGH